MPHERGGGPDRLMSAPPQAGTSARRTLSVRVLATAIVLYPLVAIFSPKALVILLIATSLALLFDGRNRANPFAVLPRGVLAFLAALAVWALVTVWWSPLPLTGLELWGRVVAIGLCGILFIASARRLTAAERGVLERSLVAAGLLFAVIFAFELITAGALSRVAVELWNDFTPWQSNPPKESILLLRASAALAAIVWPCAVAIHRRCSVWWAVAFVAVVAVNLLVQNMLASLVAFIGAIAVFVLAYATPRIAAVAVVAALALLNVLAFATAPAIVDMLREDATAFDIPGSWKERLSILDFVAGKAVDNPLFGWGFDASRAIGNQTPGVFPMHMAIPLHPHNLWAQALLELGLVGAALLAGLVIASLTHIAAMRANRAAVAAAIAAATTYLLIGNLSYGMWQNWWLAVAWLNVGFMAMLTSDDVIPRISAD